jgi:peroxiredoxin
MKTIFFTVLMAGLFSCTSKTGTPFTVEGTIKNSDAGMIYLEQNPPDRERPVVVDSAQIGKDGSFTLTTTAAEEGLFSLRTGQSQYPFAILVNDTKKITVAADLSKRPVVYTVNGSAASQQLSEFDKTYSSQSQLMSQLAEHYNSMSQAKPGMMSKEMDSARAADSIQYESVAMELKDYTRQAIDKSKSPAFITYVLYLFQGNPDEPKPVEFSPTEVAEIVNLAAGKFPDNTALTEWKKRLRPNKAPEFTLPDTSGKAISLASFRGKYVLVDFWASWCGPCRHENPNVVAAYNQFKDKNFTILGVSLDDNRQAWINAIQTDGLFWNQASDLKGWESEVATLYGVRGIPYNFLLDPNGNIVAENIRGKELFSTLANYLK